MTAHARQKSGAAPNRAPAEREIDGAAWGSRTRVMSSVILARVTHQGRLDTRCVRSGTRRMPCPVVRDDSWRVGEGGIMVLAFMMTTRRHLIATYTGSPIPLYPPSRQLEIICFRKNRLGASSIQRSIQDRTPLQTENDSLRNSDRIPRDDVAKTAGGRIGHRECSEFECPDASDIMGRPPLYIGDQDFRMNRQMRLRDQQSRHSRRGGRCRFREVTNRVISSHAHTLFRDTEGQLSRSLPIHPKRDARC